jgi:hypothetical protein
MMGYGARIKVSLRCTPLGVTRSGKVPVGRLEYAIQALEQRRHDAPWLPLSRSCEDMDSFVYHGFSKILDAPRSCPI